MLAYIIKINKRILCLILPYFGPLDCVWWWLMQFIIKQAWNQMKLTNGVSKMNQLSIWVCFRDKNRSQTLRLLEWIQSWPQDVRTRLIPTLFFTKIMKSCLSPLKLYAQHSSNTNRRTRILLIRLGKKNNSPPSENCISRWWKKNRLRKSLFISYISQIAENQPKRISSKCSQWNVKRSKNIKHILWLLKLQQIFCISPYLLKEWSNA